MLDILIPVYKEPKELIERLLDSIRLQKGINFDDIRVIIRSDGVEDYSFSTYPFRLYYYKGGHVGISESRNDLLRMSDAEYVMFCDDDDMFFSCLSLRLIFKAISTGCDNLISNFIEENSLGWFVPHEKDGTFVHGKAYRRQFLLDNDIWFDSRDIKCEDSPFNAKVHATAKSIKYLETPVYVWCWNDNSVTRSTNLYRISNLHNWIDAMNRVMLYLNKRGLPSRQVYDSVVKETRTLMNSDEWLTHDIPEQDIAEKKFNKFIRKWE